MESGGSFKTPRGGLQNDKALWSASAVHKITTKQSVRSWSKCPGFRKVIWVVVQLNREPYLLRRVEIVGPERRPEFPTGDGGRAILSVT